jgi:hypothetical protein
MKMITVANCFACPHSELQTLEDGVGDFYTCACGRREEVGGWVPIPAHSLSTIPDWCRLMDAPEEIKNTCEGCCHIAGCLHPHLGTRCDAFSPGPPADLPPGCGQSALLRAINFLLERAREDDAT